MGHMPVRHSPQWQTYGYSGRLEIGLGAATTTKINTKNMK